MSGWSGRWCRCSRRMERRGIKVDRQILSRLSGSFAQKAAAVEAEIYEIAGQNFNIGSTKQLGDILFGKLGLAGGRKTKTGAVVDRREGARGSRRGGRADRAKDRRVAAAHQAQIHLHGRASRLHPSGDRPRPHRLLARLDLDRPALVVRAEPAEHPDPHRGGPRHPPRLHRRGWLQARLRRLQPDRAARAGAHRRDPAAHAGVRRRPRHPRHDRVGNVRRAGRGHGPERAPARQGDQFRHHLRHLGLRARQSARHRARARRPTTSTAISSASPASATTWIRPSASRASTSMSRRCSAAARTIPTSAPRSRRSAPSRSAPRSTRRSRALPPTSSAAP